MFGFHFKSQSFASTKEKMFNANATGFVVVVVVALSAHSKKDVGLNPSCLSLQYSLMVFCAGCARTLAQLQLGLAPALP